MTPDKGHSVVATMPHLPPKLIWTNLLVYGAAHGVVDGTCAAVFFALFHNHAITASTVLTWAMLYNLAAFGLRCPIGLLVDYFRVSRHAAAFGCLLAAISTVTFVSMPLVAVIVGGIGNALFHVGGGGISFNLTPKRSASPGIFAGPGALGIGVGTVIGNSGHFTPWPFISLLLVSTALIYAVPMPKMDWTRRRSPNATIHIELILLLTFLAAAAGSFIGLSMAFPWKSNPLLLIILTFGVSLGRGIGGVIADKFGWLPVTIITLLASIPFLACGASIPYVAIAGMIFFSMNVAIMLTMISNMLPGKPSFAFGLASLALVLGGLVAFSKLQQLFATPFVVATSIFIFALMLYAGLRLYNKTTNENQIKLFPQSQ